jgi:hypothetical protein
MARYTPCVAVESNPQPLAPVSPRCGFDLPELLWPGLKNRQKSSVRIERGGPARGCAGTVAAGGAGGGRSTHLQFNVLDKKKTF